MPKVKLDVKIPISVLREGKNFIVYSPVLDLSTSGKTYEEATRRFGEAIEIFFEEILKKGTLNEVLEELGWTKQRARWQPPSLICQDVQRIRIASS